MLQDTLKASLDPKGVSIFHSWQAVWSDDACSMLWSMRHAIEAQRMIREKGTIAIISYLPDLLQLFFAERSRERQTQCIGLSIEASVSDPGVMTCLPFVYALVAFETDLQRRDLHFSTKTFA